MYPTTGYTPAIPERERMENQLDAAIEQLGLLPGNEYWENLRDSAANFLYGEEIDEEILAKIEETEHYDSQAEKAADRREILTPPHR